MLPHTFLSYIILFLFSMEAAALLLDPNLSSRCGPKAGDILHQMLYFFRLFSDQCLSHTIENPKFQGYSKQEEMV